jgi:benzoate-CoA ligase
MIDQVMAGDHNPKVKMPDAMLDIPRNYNAATDLIGRNLAAGRGGKIAYIDDAGGCTYAQLAERVDRAVNGLHSLGIRR